MAKEWIYDSQEGDPKYKRETLLNYAMNRWGLNKANSVGSTSELIRSCSPKQYAEWEKYYFEKAHQKKKEGLKLQESISLGWVKLFSLNCLK